MWFNKTSAFNDLVPKTFPALDWAPAKLNESLTQLHLYAVSEAERAIAWYETKRKRMRIGGQILRIGAIFAAAAAGLIPVLGQVFELAKGRPGIAPGWSAVAVGVAALLISLDKFWGFTNAWVRFMLAEQDLSAVVITFHFDWETAMYARATAGASIEEAAAMISQCKLFLEQIHAIVRRETTSWVSDFQSAVIQVDSAAKLTATAKGNGTGAISVEIANGDQCEAGWQLIIDDAAPIAGVGKGAAVRNLVPEIHTVMVTATLHGRPVRDEKPVVVSPGGIAHIELTLA